MNSIFCIGLLFLCSAQLTFQQQCPSVDFNRSIDVSFTAHRNRSCHYIMDWSAKNESPNLPEHLKIDVLSSRSDSECLQTFEIKGTIAVPPPVPSGYEYFPGVGYYKFFPVGESSYYEAMRICENDSAHLAIINSVSESEVLKSIYAKFPEAWEFAYIGFNDIEEEGKYVTIFGKPLEETGFTTWYPGEPNNMNDEEDCGSVHRSGVLNDVKCAYSNGPMPFFCEFDLSWAIN